MIWMNIDSTVVILYDHTIVFNWSRIVVKEGENFISPHSLQQTGQ